MQSQQRVEDLGFDSPSFSYYYSDTLTFKAVTKVIHEDHAAQVQDFEGDDYEFSFVLTEERPKDIESQDLAVYPVFNHDNKIDVSVSINRSLRKIFVDEELVSSSYSSSSESEEANEMENIPSGRFCVWRRNLSSGSSSPQMTKCKKSSSTGSRTKRWSIRYLLKRSNSECNVKPMALLSSNKKVESPKHKVTGRLKVQRPVHEQFYVQRRAENEIVKKKSFLPYRQNLVGLFANINGMGKMLPF
ncbi:reverse transcriptase domain-containing protein [Tanacetum coccineum]